MLNSAASLLLSLIAPGAGQIYNGQFVKGAVTVCIFVFGRYIILPLFIRIINFKNSVNNLKLIYVFNILYPALMITAAADASYNAFHLQGSLLAFILCFIFAVILSSAYHGLRSEFIVFAMSGREDLVKFIIPKK